MENSKIFFYQSVLSDKNGKVLSTGPFCYDMPSVFEQIDALTSFFGIVIFCDPREVVVPTILERLHTGHYHCYKKVYNHKGDYLYLGFICYEVEENGI